MQCSPTGSVYNRTELHSVAVLCTVMPLWGFKTHICMDGMFSDYQAI